MSKTQNIEQFSYPNLLAQVKERVKLAQQRAIYAANDELLRMYWDIGHILCEEKKKIGWGNGALKRLSEDMHNYYPEIKGFSVRNCQCMIQFYEEYNQELTLPKSGTPIAQLPVAQLPEYNFTLVAKIRSKPNTHCVISTNQ
jgi:hypothetical protein